MEAKKFEETLNVVAVGLEPAPGDETLTNNHKVAWHKYTESEMAAGEKDAAPRLRDLRRPVGSGGRAGPRRGPVLLHPQHPVWQAASLRPPPETASACRTDPRKVDGRPGTYPLRISNRSRPTRRGAQDHGRLFVPPATPAGTLGRMCDVTHLLDAAATGDPQAAAKLLPLAFDELRKLAATHM